MADPYTGYDIYDSVPDGGRKGWQTFGGTSLSSPLIAAMWALAGGAKGVSSPGSVLYKNYASTKSAFYDVTVGSNSYCGGDTPASCAKKGPAGPIVNKSSYGDIDCSFATFSMGGSAIVANNLQCNAAKGFDGPSGLGTPNGLAAFRK